MNSTPTHHAATPAARSGTGPNALPRRVSILEWMVWGLALAGALATGWTVHRQRVTEPMQQVARARETVHALSSALQAPRAQPQLPSSQAGLEALAQDGTIDHMPLDPWGRAYVYRYPGNFAAYELFSLGPDGVESMDDIVNWNLYGGRAPGTLTAPTTPSAPPSQPAKPQP